MPRAARSVYSIGVPCGIVSDAVTKSLSIGGKNEKFILAGPMPATAVVRAITRTATPAAITEYRLARARSRSGR